MDDYESQTDRLKYMVSHSPISVTQHHRQIDDPYAKKTFIWNEERRQCMTRTSGSEKNTSNLHSKFNMHLNSRGKHRRIDERELGVTAKKYK